MDGSSGLHCIRSVTVSFERGNVLLRCSTEIMYHRRLGSPHVRLQCPWHLHSLRSSISSALTSSPVLIGPEAIRLLTIVSKELQSPVAEKCYYSRASLQAVESRIW